MTQDKKTLPETIIIDSSTLKLLLTEYKDNLSKINDWAVPLSIFVSLTLALLASDFKSFSWVEGKQLQGATTTLAALSFLWFATAVIRQTKDNPMDALLSKIANNLKNIPEYTALCFIKQTKNNIVKLLVMKNNNWNAYFLPYTPYNPNQTIHDQTSVVLNGIVARLGTTADDVVVEYIQEGRLRNEKYSETERIIKQFNFEFFSIFIPAEKAKTIIEESFKIGGREFCWMTLDELEEDPNTMRVNGDVVNHLRRHYNSFFRIKDAIK